jgi:hypothetical protein
MSPGRVHCSNWSNPHQYPDSSGNPVAAVTNLGRAARTIKRDSSRYSENAEPAAVYLQTPTPSSTGRACTLPYERRLHTSPSSDSAYSAYRKGFEGKLIRRKSTTDFNTSQPVPSTSTATEADPEILRIKCTTVGPP